MLDINHIINDPKHDEIDPEGHMYDLEHWSPLTAKKWAQEEGIGELTEDHWHVIYALRNLYRENGAAANAREVDARAGSKISSTQAGAGISTSCSRKAPSARVRAWPASRFRLTPAILRLAGQPDGIQGAVTQYLTPIFVGRKLH